MMHQLSYQIHKSHQYFITNGDKSPEYLISRCYVCYKLKNILPQVKKSFLNVWNACKISVICTETIKINYTMIG